LKNEKRFLSRDFNCAYVSFNFSHQPSNNSESKLATLTEKVNIKHPVDPKNVDIQKDPFHPTAYIITVPLDTEPSYIWHTLFEQELWSSLDFWDRKVLIVSKALKLTTTPDRVEEKLHWLEGLVLATNKRVEECNKKVRAEKDASKSKIMDEEAIRKDVSSWAVGRVRG